MTAVGLVFIRKRTYKGRLKTDITWFAKSFSDDLFFKAKSTCRLAQSLSCSGEEAVPAGQFRPVFRFPAHLRGAVHAFGMGHHDGDAAVGVGNAGDALWRAVGVERVGLGYLVLSVDVLQRDAEAV